MDIRIEMLTVQNGHLFTRMSYAGGRGLLSGDDPKFDSSRRGSARSSSLSGARGYSAGQNAKDPHRPKQDSKPETKDLESLP
jgi:hypothetical protein